MKKQKQLSCFSKNKWIEHVNFIQSSYEFSEIGKTVVLRNEDGLLHNQNGPAVVTHTRISHYVNGRRHGPEIHKHGGILYYYKGVLVPSKFYLHPEKISFNDLMSYDNVEVRQVGFEIYLTHHSLESVVRSKRLIQMDHNDKRNETLYKLNIGLSNEDNYCILKVLDATPDENGNYRVFYLKVPPTMTSAAAAAAWTFKKDVNNYAPMVET